MVYDRATGTTTELLGTRLVVLESTPDGRFVDGVFGGLSLFDPASMAWDVALSEGSVDVSWSDDYRFASRGQQPGHGGFCPV